MQIKRHRNGTFSITDLTINDVRTLSINASTAAAYPARWSGMDATDIAFIARATKAADRLASALWDLAQGRQATTVTLVSDQFDGITRDDVYSKEA